MTKISKEDVDHMASLARLKLGDDEKEQTGKELEAILDYAAEIEEAPTDNLESIEQISNLKNITRADEVVPSLPVEKVLQNAPDKKDNFIKVKQVFE